MSYKRTLLLVFIHGFVGDETSFQSFPAHVHNAATEMVSETHVVNTKIYPRYKSRGAIQHARDDFSRWLSPHESPETDIILLGHSMGGILSAEVTLLPPFSPDNHEPFFHRILGTINFDTPFLGMHPGVVKSGLGSIFNPPSPTASAQAQAHGSSDNVLMPMPTGESSQNPQATSPGPSSPSGASFSTPVNDPNYNPPFENDVNIPVRKGWENAWHFLNKHSDDLAHATKKYVTSHFEFGGAMADYRTLSSRYKKLRSLEDIDNGAQPTSSRPMRRIRFVNYYTASTGRVKPKPRSPSRGREADVQKENIEEGMQELHVGDLAGRTQSRSKSPKISIEDPEGSVAVVHQGNEGEESADIPEKSSRSSVSERGSLDQMEPKPVEETMVGVVPPEAMGSESAAPEKAVERTTTDMRASRHQIEFPPLPPEPSKPADFDPSPFEDEGVKKLAEKDHKRQMKAYQQALKDREKAIKERNKMMEKREKTVRKEQDKALKEERKSQQKAEKDRLKAEKEKAETQRSEASKPSIDDGSRGVALEPTESRGRSSESADEIQTADLGTNEAARGAGSKEKKKKDKKFCMLPKAGPDGQRDPTWIRVFMEGVDEVGAHCGLFFSENPHYQKLVADVGDKVLQWIVEDIIAKRSRSRAMAGPS